MHTSTLLLAHAVGVLGCILLNDSVARAESGAADLRAILESRFETSSLHLTAKITGSEYDQPYEYQFEFWAKDNMRRRDEYAQGAEKRRMQLLDGEYYYIFNQNYESPGLVMQPVEQVESTPGPSGMKIPDPRIIGLLPFGLRSYENLSPDVFLPADGQVEINRLERDGEVILTWSRPDQGLDWRIELEKSPRLRPTTVLCWWDDESGSHVDSIECEYTNSRVGGEAYPSRVNYTHTDNDATTRWETMLIDVIAIGSEVDVSALNIQNCGVPVLTPVVTDGSQMWWDGREAVDETGVQRIRKQPSLTRWAVSIIVGIAVSAVGLYFLKARKAKRVVEA